VSGPPAAEARVVSPVVAAAELGTFFSRVPRFAARAAAELLRQACAHRRIRLVQAVAKKGNELVLVVFVESIGLTELGTSDAVHAVTPHELRRGEGLAAGCVARADALGSVKSQRRVGPRPGCSLSCKVHSYPGLKVGSAPDVPAAVG